MSVIEHLPNDDWTAARQIYLNELNGQWVQIHDDKINLSNSSHLNSTGIDMQATDNNVIVSWWETSSTSAKW